MAPLLLMCVFAVLPQLSVPAVQDGRVWLEAAQAQLDARPALWLRASATRNELLTRGTWIARGEVRLAAAQRFLEVQADPAQAGEPLLRIAAQITPPAAQGLPRTVWLDFNGLRWLYADEQGKVLVDGLHPGLAGEYSSLAALLVPPEFYLGARLTEASCCSVGAAGPAELQEVVLGGSRCRLLELPASPTESLSRWALPFDASLPQLVEREYKDGDAILASTRWTLLEWAALEAAPTVPNAPAIDASWRWQAPADELQDLPGLGPEQVVSSLHASLDPLRTSFNAGAERLRVLGLFSPTCLNCLRAVRETSEVLEREFAQRPVEFSVVWVDVLAGDDLAAARRASRVVTGSQVRHFHDDDRVAARAFAPHLGVPAARDLVATLGAREELLPIFCSDFLDGSVGVTYDSVLFFEPGVRWRSGEAPPAPEQYLHQLDPAVYVGLAPERFFWGPDYPPQLSKLLHELLLRHGL